MAIDTQSLTQLITEFRSLNAKDSITPESLGSILQRITDLLATAGSSDTITKIQELLDGFKAAGYAITSISSVQTDPNNIYAKIGKVSLGDGTVSQSSTVFIQQATTEHAGAMRAQQVTDLNQAQTNVAALQKQCSALEESLINLQNSLGIGDGTSLNKIINTVQIAVRSVDNVLHVFGASKLISAGYVPYLFRWTRKRNRYHHKSRTDEDQDRQYCSETKGWHLYGSCHAVKVSSGKVMFSTNERFILHQKALEYSTSPETLVRYKNSDDNDTIAWGRSRICLIDKRSKTMKHRMIRLRFALGFAKIMYPGCINITPANLVSSLAEFEVIYEPNYKRWYFGK